MRTLALLSILCVSSMLVASFVKQPPTKDRLLTIQWQKDLEGDFSFKNDWSYPLGVYINQWGQVGCDGFCPLETDAMSDSLGRLYEDSLTSFYEIVDTTHLAHSLFLEGSLYEYTGSEHMNFKRTEDGRVRGKSTCNASTHTSLNIEITDGKIIAWLDFVGIRDVKRHTFPLKDGWIKMDKRLYQKGIVKATFSFDFKNTLESSFPLNCEGMIYSEIQ